MILRKFGKRWDLDEFEEPGTEACLHLGKHMCALTYLDVWTNLTKVLENQTFHRSYAEIGIGKEGWGHFTELNRRGEKCTQVLRAHVSDGETVLSQIGDQCRFFREELIRYLQQWVNKCFSLLLISTPELSSRVYMSIPY